MRNCYVVKINKIYKPLTRLVKKKKKSARAQVTNIRNERTVIITSGTGTYKTGDYYEQCSANNFKSLNQMSNFFEKCNLPKLTWHKGQNLNNPMCRK